MVAMKYLSFALALMMMGSANGFAVDSKIIAGRSLTPKSQQRGLDSSLHVFAMDGAFSALDSFFQTDPYLAAFLTCSAKASAADWVAQSQQEEKNVPRNLAFILYGGLYQGCVQTFIYSVLFPMLFPDPSAQTVLSQVAIDLFILGPMVCMPTVYTMKALFAGQDGLAGIQKYVDHVQNKGILLKYWSIWGPVQTLNFGIIPHHLRVPFVAVISFFWICLLSTVSSSESESLSLEDKIPSPPQLQLQEQSDYQYHHFFPQVTPVRVLSDAFTAEAASVASRWARSTSS